MTAIKIIADLEELLRQARQRVSEVDAIIRAQISEVANLQERIELLKAGPEASLVRELVERVRELEAREIWAQENFERMKRTYLAQIESQQEQLAACPGPVPPGKFDIAVKRLFLNGRQILRKIAVDDGDGLPTGGINEHAERLTIAERQELLEYIDNELEELRSFFTDREIPEFDDTDEQVVGRWLDGHRDADNMSEQEQAALLTFLETIDKPLTSLLRITSDHG